jgi:colicin import membrane protein
MTAATAATAADDRLAFAPPKQPGLMRSFALAVLAHALLVLGLMQGLQWKRDSQELAVEAELWSAVPQQAAPREIPVPPAPKPEPQPQPPQPVVKAPPPPEPPVQRDADIALEREKQKRELEKQKQAELEREREQRRKLEAQKKREEELALKKQEQREEELARKKQEQQKLADAKRKEDEAKRKAQEQETRLAKQREQIREENLKRSLAMAGTGEPGSTGTAARSSGPSAGWGARVQARVRPNIVFTDDIGGNPEAVVEVRLAPDGTIVSKRLKKSSGHRGWDEAVLRALDRTEVLPRDTDGRVPAGGDLVFRPRG